MALSFNDYIYEVYRYHQIRNSNIWDGTSFDDVGPVSLKIDISSDIIEIPCFAFNYVLPYLESPAPNIKDLYVPLTIQAINPTSYKSANPIIKYFFTDAGDSRHRGSGNLATVYGNDIKYIGSKGVIFYDNFIPMLLFTLVLKKEEDSYSIIGQNLRIDPRVYTREDLLSKHIRGKFLSNLISMRYMYHTSSSIRYYSMILSGNDTLDNQIQVIVDPIDKFFVFPTIPNVQVSKEAINNFLLEYEDIIE